MYFYMYMLTYSDYMCIYMGKYNIYTLNNPLPSLIAWWESQGEISFLFTSINILHRKGKAYKNIHFQVTITKENS